MIHRLRILTNIILLVVASIFTSCSNDDNIPDDSGETARLHLSLRAGTVADPLTKGKDSKFMNVAIYIFNENDGRCEYAELIPNFGYPDPSSGEESGAIKLTEYSRSVQVSQQTKIIYAIGNYNHQDKNLVEALSEDNTTIEKLEAMIVNNTQEFSDSTLLMVGKQRVEINSSFVQAEVPMERLAARVDIHMFKNVKFSADDVKVNFVEFRNQIWNSNAAYQNPTMLSPEKRNYIKNFNGSLTLENMPIEPPDMSPDRAQLSLYTYQNIAQSITPDEIITPYLRIGISVNGLDYVYKGYITDDGHNDDKYSLKRNTVYRVIAMLDNPDNKLILKVIPLPWSVAESQTGGTVTGSDYVFDSWNFDANAVLGEIYYPFADGGVPRDETSYANYSFKLTAPAGKIWTATLTNGLDFKFGDIDANTGRRAVSQGIAGEEASMIKVGATKRWSGVEKSTYMYITVDGEKLTINPVQSNGYRKFPGNDTDVLIVQKEYQ